MPVIMNRASKLPPGPRTYQLGNVASFQHQPVAAFGELWQTYGDLVLLPILPGYRMLLVSHPRHAEHIFATHPDRYRKTDLLLKNMGLVQGKGLFTSEGPEWLRHRRLMQPAFQQKHMHQLHQVIVDCVEALLQTWSQQPDGTVIDMAAAMTQLTLKTVSLALFSVDISKDSSELGYACRHAFEYVYYRMANPLILPARFPTPRNRQFWQAKQTIDRVVQDLIAHRRQTARQPTDLLALLLAAQDEETGAGMSNQQLQDEVITMINAGHETSATALAWIWVLVGQHPDVLQRLTDELQTVLTGAPITPETLPKLTYTRQVIDEALRLRNPGLGSMRTVAQTDEIDGYRIPQGTQCLILQTHMARHPEFWSHPEQFDPDRFAPEQNTRRHKYAYFPFGAGPHVCIGKNFALMELMIVLASIVQTFRIELVPDQSFEIDPRFTLRPKYGVKVRLYRRA